MLRVYDWKFKKKNNYSGSRTPIASPAPYAIAMSNKFQNTAV